MDKAYVSQERYDELAAEIRKLKSEGRNEVAQRLKQAKELGDLSENSEYQEAREEQERLEKKISELDELFTHASIIKKTGVPEAVKIGAKVKIKKNGEVITYTIVGSHESDPSRGFISNESPVGKALLDKKVGDAVLVKTAKGETSYQILSID